MAKSDMPFRELKLSKAYQPPRKPSFASDKPINGFDTETADGKVFALSYAFENDHTGVIYDKEFLTSDQIFSLITNRKCRNSINVWYNLNFDANVILNHLLNSEQWAKMSVTGTVETDKYTITFIPSKFLKIKDENRHTYYHYDVSQFFYTSLANAANEWLGQTKADEGFDITQFGAKNNCVNDYILNHWDDIIEYAKKDADLVKDLWREAVNVGENLNIPMGKPFSTGFLAESYLNSHLGEKPGVGPRPVAELAWSSYAGGRFEVIKRGHVGPVAGPDINSAYPHFLSQLPDPKTLNWRHIEDNNIERITKADYGFLDVTVSTDNNRAIQPFVYKESDNEVVKYPAFNGERIQVVKDIFVHAYENNYVTDFNIHNGWLGHESVGTSFPFTFIPDKYNERKDFETNGYMKKGQLLKIILNSMYGKMCQTTPKRRELKEETNLRDDGYKEYYLSDMQLPIDIREGYQNGIIEYLEVGAWFNPFLAAYITGLTRLELHKRILEHDLEKNTVMLATDSLMIEKEAFDRSGFADNLVKDGLGNWDYDYTGNAFVIGPGVYQVEQEGKTKIKTRGFNESDLLNQFNSLTHAASQYQEKIPIQSTRPRTAAELIWSNDSIQDVGKFVEMSRELSADFDSKRQWPERCNYEILLNNVQNSKPLIA